MQPTLNELPGSATVAASINEISCTSMGFHASRVKWLAIIDAAGHTHRADAKTLLRRDYPFTRPLYIYVNKPPGKPLDPLTLAFLASVLSPEGQAQLSQSDYIPLPESQRLAGAVGGGIAHSRAGESFTLNMNKFQ